jgi:hypothetical protein
MTETKPTVLIFEDDPEVRESLSVAGFIKQAQKT